MINLPLIYSSLPQLINGALVSIQITIGALCIGLILGIILGVLHSRSNRIIKFLVSFYVILIRGTPMLVQITFFYYVLPRMGVAFSSVWTAIIAIGINSSAYVSQIIKSGISAVGKDQIEAAKVLGFNKIQTIYYVILPQAVRYVLPSLANEGVTLIKDSSLASIIGVMELYKEARSIINQTYDVISLFVIVAIIYLILTSSISAIAHILEKRMDKYA
jgi:polar amino acid transport system permease protein